MPLSSSEASNLPLSLLSFVLRIKPAKEKGVISPCLPGWPQHHSNYFCFRSHWCFYQPLQTVTTHYVKATEHYVKASMSLSTWTAVKSVLNSFNVRVNINNFIVISMELISIECHLIGLSSLSRNRMPFHYSSVTSTDLCVVNGGFCECVWQEDIWEIPKCSVNKNT